MNILMYLCSTGGVLCSMGRVLYDSIGGVHMSGVTASRGEMMQVTPDVARDQGEFFFISCFARK